MQLSEIKNILYNLESIEFQLEDGTKIPSHFHVTEVGVIIKNFIDCGGTIRNEKVANFQLWSANDLEHQLRPIKLLNIIKLSEEKLSMENLEIEVEYQGQKTIGKYGLDFKNNIFVLTAKQTTCLAQDNCGIPKEEIQPSKLEKNTCTPGGGCC